MSCRLGSKDAHAPCNINTGKITTEKGVTKDERILLKKGPLVKSQQVRTKTSLLKIKLAATKKFKQRSSASDVRKESLFVMTHKMAY